MGGVTSPARPWFHLTTPDPDLAEFGAVKDWLDIVSQRMHSVFGRSNLYNHLKVLYKDIGVFGTGCMLVEEDFESVLRCYAFPIGSYYIANDERLKVGLYGRDFRMTVRQLIKAFGDYDQKTGKPNWDKFSSFVRSAYDKSDYEVWIDIRHFIMPNEEYDDSQLSAKHKKFASCYYEAGNSGKGSANYITSSDEDRYLRESGYDNFPVLAPRWEVAGEDVYGTSCPGVQAIGDIRALQLMHKRKAEAIEKMVRPPLTGPTSLRNQKVSILPADVTYSDVRDGQMGLRPIFEVRPDVQHLLLDIQDHQQRIKQTFFTDLFLMLSQSDRREITAREIDERREEKLLALGPVLEQLNQDLLDPLIDLCFDYLAKRGDLPPPPPELEGMDLKVEYVSMMAQAQKLIAISGVERFAGFVGKVVAETQNMEILDKVDMDQMIDVYAEITSLPRGIVRTDEKVEALRGQRRKAAQAQQQAEVANEAASAAQKLSQTDMSGENALTNLLATSNAGRITPEGA